MSPSVRVSKLACLVCVLAGVLLGPTAWAQDAAAEEHYANSLRLLTSGELAHAAEESSSAIKLAPAWAEPHLLRGRIYAAQKQPREAQAMFQQAIRLKPGFAEAYLALGLLQLQQKDHDKAVVSLREAIHLKPTYALARLSLGNAYLAAENLPDAIKEFQATLDLRSQERGLSFFANFGLGSAYYKRHDYTRALEQFEQARTLKPGDPEVLFTLCEVYFKVQRDSDALAVAQELAPVESRIPGMPLRAGLLLGDNERYAEALPHLKGAEAQGPASFELYEALGAADYNLDRYTEAIRALTHALEFSAKFPQTYFILAKAYAAQDDPRALEALQDCVKLDPNRDDAWEALSQELARRKAADDALKIFGRYAESFPQKPLAHLLLGEAYFNQALYLKATGEFQKAAALAPQLGRARYSIGLAYKTMGKYREAKEQFRQALALDPSLFLADYHLGDILGGQGDYDESIRLLDMAIKLNPQYPEAYVKLGEDYFRRKNYGKAEECLKQATHLQPGDAQAHFLLSRIYIASNEPELGEAEFDLFRSLRKKETEANNGSGLTYKK